MSESSERQQCTDHGCVFRATPGKGMGTNGGCHCLADLGVPYGPQQAMVRRAIQAMRAELEEKLAAARAIIHQVADKLGCVSWSDGGRYVQAEDDKIVEAAQQAAQGEARMLAAEAELAEARAQLAELKHSVRADGVLAQLREIVHSLEIDPDAEPWGRLNSALVLLDHRDKELAEARATIARLEAEHRALRKEASRG